MRAFQDMLLQPLKALLMRALQQQLSKYIHNIELEELGLLGGDVVLENLEIRKDVLHDSLRIPTDYDFSRGFIKELRIHIPWTRLQSRPIEIKFKTVEIIISPTVHTRAGSDRSSPWLQRAPHSRQSRAGEEQASSSGAATGWMQQLLTKVLANMSVSVSNLVLKYEDADVVLSAALKSLTCFSADPDQNWTPAYATLDDPFGLLHKLVRASDLTVCLDRYCVPDSSNRRQVQAFEVPILNRASLDVQLLACVWLVAPGPGEGVGTGSEDGQTHTEWRDFPDEDAAEVSGTSWGVGERGDAGLQSKNNSRVGVLGRLVGVDLRSSPKSSAIGSARANRNLPNAEGGTTEGTSSIFAGTTSANREISWLPLPCVCQMLRDGWSRRASSSYSPFYDGNGVWNRNETDSAAAPARMGIATAVEIGAATSFAGTGVQGEAEQGELLMPSPTIVADIFIDELSFSLSNLQVLMMKELIDSAVRHVASNASRNDRYRRSAHVERPPTPVQEAAPPVSRSWWPSFWRGTTSKADDTPTANAEEKGMGMGESSEDTDALDDGDAIFFVVVSASVRNLSLSLLEHQPQTVRKGTAEAEDESIAEEEPESISVPVHGLGTVSVLSTPITPRPILRPPVAFVVAEVAGVVLDAHVLPDGTELSTDLKVQVPSVCVRHAQHEYGAKFFSEETFRQDEVQRAPNVQRSDHLNPELIISWGDTVGKPVAASSHGEEKTDNAEVNLTPFDIGDPRSAASVRRCLVDRLRRIPLPSTNEMNESASDPGKVNRALSLQEESRVALSPAQPPVRRVTCSKGAARVGGDNALQFRFLKQKDAADGSLGGDVSATVVTSTTSVFHDLRLGPFRAHLTEALLEQLLAFAGIGKRGKRSAVADTGGGRSSNEESEQARAVDDATTGLATAPPARSASVPPAGEPWRVRRASWSPIRDSGTRSAIPRTRTVSVPAPFIATSETSLHFVLLSADVALDLATARQDVKKAVRAVAGDTPAFSMSEDSEASLILAVVQVELHASESASHYPGADRQELERRDSAVSHGNLEDAACKRVCSLLTEILSLTYLDESQSKWKTQAPIAPSCFPSSPAERIFTAAARPDLPPTHRLVRLRGVRATAEVSTTVPQVAVSATSSRCELKPNYDVTFNASCESMHACFSPGIALLVLELCALARKVDVGEAVAGAARSFSSHTEAGTDASPYRWRNAWRRGLSSCFEGLSLEGVAKSGSYRLTGNMRLLRVDRTDDKWRDRDVLDGSSNVAVFQAPDDDSEALSWTIETFKEGGVTGISLTSDFKSAILHYANSRRAFSDLQRAMKAWEIRNGNARLNSGGYLATESHAPNTAQKRRNGAVHFDIRGTAVSLQLPFELLLVTKGVRASSRRIPRIAVRGRTSGHRNIDNNGDMMIDLVAGDVKVFHAMHGSHCSPADAQLPAIHCGARGIVSLKPSVNATSVGLDSEHVYARLTPAFCASFGSFVRFMIGPPPVKSAAAGIAGDDDLDGIPPSFCFELGVREVIADFVTGPCNPWGVSANLVVDDVLMRQKTTAAPRRSPEVGSQASFEMSFGKIEGTQRRDPRRNAPALPQAATVLVGQFVGRSSGGDEHAVNVFVRWVSTRRGATPAVFDEDGEIGYQPFMIPLARKSGSAIGGRAFSVISTISGPRERLVNGLTLRLAPMLLACYPPVVRLLVGHYNRFGGQAFRQFPSRSDLPRRKVGVMTYDIDIRDCGAVLLASLAVGARGVHVSAEQVTVNKIASPMRAKLSVPIATLDTPSWRQDESAIPLEQAVSMAGFVGPAKLAFVKDWRDLLPAHAQFAQKAGVDATPLCVPIDLRWTVHYGHADRFRQDVSLSSVQLYLEQPHFDLFARLVKTAAAADFPGALPPKLRLSSVGSGGIAAGLAVDDASPGAAAEELSDSTRPGRLSRSSFGGSEDNNHDDLLDLSLRLPLLQVVLAMGNRDGPAPPVLEIDIASIRLTHGGVLTVRHVSVNSWPQQQQDVEAAEFVSAHGDGNGNGERGYRVFERSGQSEESGKDFARVEVRAPTAIGQGGTASPKRGQLDVVLQVEPFNVHINPDIILALTAYVTPVPFDVGSPEAGEAPFPYSVRAEAIVNRSRSRHGNASTTLSTAVNDLYGSDRPHSSSSAARQSLQFEKTAKTAAASAKIIASQVSVILSSYPGGPAYIATASHIFVRAITRPPKDGNGGERDAADADGTGPELVARLSRISCSVDHSHGRPFSVQNNMTWAAGSRRTELHLGDAVLKPFDLDVHLTRRQWSGSNDELSTAKAQGWHAAIFADEIYLRLGAVHTRSLECLADLFVPATSKAERTLADLVSIPGYHEELGSTQALGLAHVDDLRILKRVDSIHSVREGTAKPRPGQVCFYGAAMVRSDASAEDFGLTQKERNEDDEWVICCEWQYWGLKRVAQVALPRTPISGSVPLLEELMLDSLEVELSFLDPLTGMYKAATRFKVACETSNTPPSGFFSAPPQATVEPSQAFHARRWRLAWRVPTWVRRPGGISPPSPSALAVSAWSAALLSSLSIRSTPASPASEPSHTSTMLDVQRLTLALLTDDVPLEVSPAGTGDSGQPEEMVRVVFDGLNVFAEVGSGDGDRRGPAAASATAATTRGSALVAVEVQDFSNFLRLPLLSHALVKWDVSNSGGNISRSRGRGTRRDALLLSPFRPVVSAAVEMQDAVISVSATAMQCINRCLGELSRPSGGGGVNTMDAVISAPHPTQVRPSQSGSRRPLSLPKMQRKGYVLTNRTDRALWFGQVSTTETIVLGPSASTAYRWRTIPTTVVSAAKGLKGGEPPRLALLLRLALHCDTVGATPVRHTGGGDGTARGSGSGSFGAWTEPFAADHEGTFVRLLRSAGGDGQPITSGAGAIGGTDNTTAVPLWIVVSKEGLQTRIKLFGEWVFTNNLPQQVRVAWTTAAGVGNAARSSVEPPGVRGGLKLAACGPGRVSCNVDPGSESQVPRPTSSSALTACLPVPIPGATGEVQGRLSELMLEFRLSRSGSAAVVGSVGPPPTTHTNVAFSGGRGAGRGGRDAGIERVGGGEPLHDRSDRLNDVAGEMSWAATRHSDWVEGRPGVHLSLISCASPDPSSSGFWFWCVASRQVAPLGDCGACISREPGHRCHLGQMMIDLRPMAMVWNRCSLPLRVALGHAGRGRGSAETAFVSEEGEAYRGVGATLDDAKARLAAVSQGDMESMNTTRAEDENPACDASAFRMEDSVCPLQPGGRVAICRRPFVDYHLKVEAAATRKVDVAPNLETRRSSSEQSAQPFLVSVPSELFFQTCKAQWLPLHERALKENVLCPVVVVASRPLDAHWPSLSLRVYPGLSIRNHLPLPLSLRAVFSRPSDSKTSVATPEEFSRSTLEVQPERSVASTGDSLRQDPKTPLLRHGGTGEEGSSSPLGDTSKDVARISRVFDTPAESFYSVWGIHDGLDDAIPLLFPTVSLEIGMIAEGEQSAILPVESTANSSFFVNTPPNTGEPRTAGHEQQPTRRSPPLAVNLAGELSELVLVPWSPAAEAAASPNNDASPQENSVQENVVVPVFVTIAREAVPGGVDLVRLEIHPRVIVHNATNLPISLSLLGVRSDTPPLCRVHLTPDGRRSSMAVLALPGRRGQMLAASPNLIDTPRSARGQDDMEALSAATDDGVDPAVSQKSKTSRTLNYGLSWLMKNASYKAAPVKPTGFWADIEVAFGWEREAKDLPPAQGKAETVGGETDAPDRTSSAGRKKSVISLLERTGGTPLQCEPASITVATESRRRAARVCVTTEIQTRGKSESSMQSSPTRHILLHQDSQPDLIVLNRATGPVTIAFDCGSVLEVGPGETAEHSWPDLSGRDHVVGGSATKRPPRPPLASPLDSRQHGRGLSETRSRNGSDSSLVSSTALSSSPASPVSAAVLGSGTPRERGSSRLSGVNNAGSPVGSKGRSPGKVFGSGDATTLQHWFRCKGGWQGDQSLSWSNPLWVARGVQVLHFDRHILGIYAGEVPRDPDDRDSEHRGSHDWEFGSLGGDGGGFGIGPDAREVQVHVMERAGGFVMSFAEGGFEGVSTEGESMGGGQDTSAEEKRSVLGRWAETREQHLILTVSTTTIQLLDDSNLTAVPGATRRRGNASGERGASASASATRDARTRVMDGWIGGNWEGPGGLLSDATSAALPAAAIPAILSVFIGGSRTRLWRAAPAVRQGMLTLDLERYWHLKDRVGVDVCLEMLQVDNHVAGHNFPVIFCFRRGGGLVHGSETSGGGGGEKTSNDCRFSLSLLLAEPWDDSRMPAYLENVSVQSAPMDVCFEDSVLPPLVKFFERAGLGTSATDGSYAFGASSRGPNSASTTPAAVDGAQIPASLAATMVPRLFIQRVDIGALVVRATVQGYIPGKHVFLSLDKSPLLFRPVALRGVLARSDEIAEQIASNYAVDALLRSLAVVGSLQALGSPTTLLTEWGKGVYDLFAMPIKAVPQGPSSTIRATFSGLSSLVRHASAGTLSSVSGVTNALSRNLGGRGGVVRPIAGTMSLVHRTSRSLMASTGVDIEWAHAEASAAANPAVCRLNADLWYRWCLLPPGHEFLYRTPAMCSNASYSQANVPVTIVLSSKAVFLYRGGTGCETLWKQIDHQHITLVEQSAEHAPAELILNARAFLRPRRRFATSISRTAKGAAAAGGQEGLGNRGFGQDDEAEVGGLLMKLSLPNSACCRELAQLLQGLSENA